jgi:Protein of unknown function (DUF3631)
MIKRLRRHLSASDDALIAGALWAWMSWLHQDCATHSPILLFTSPEANSGKTTFLRLVLLMAKRGLPNVEASSAVLFRSIQKWNPTFGLDEADDMFRDKPDLRAVVNSGHTRGEGVLRCDGDENEPRMFSTFTPKAVAMKGRNLPETTLTRCIEIKMQRKRADEPKSHFDHLDDDELADIRSQMARWAEDHKMDLIRANPDLPSGFYNRLGDNWRLLFAIADVIGGEWPEKVRTAAAVISRTAGDTSSTGERLLADIRAAFDEVAGTNSLSSAVLVEHLTADANGPWAEWSNGKPLTPAKLARLLKNYGIAPANICPETRLRGYARAWFEDAWGRYLAPADDGSDQ